MDLNTVYLALDSGVYSTRTIASCANAASSCWSAYGSGLPAFPVVGLIALPTTSATHLLLAATYGRGLWQTPLWTAGTELTTATATPTSLSFTAQASSTSSNAQTVTIQNTGIPTLLPTTIEMTGAFSETDTCQGATINAGQSCTIQVVFSPTSTGNLTGQMTIGANIAGGEVTVPLSGTGVAAGNITLAPSSIVFDSSPSQGASMVLVGQTSAAFQATLQNTGGAAISYTTAISGPFAISSDACAESGAGLVPADTACQLSLTFSPTAEGVATGTLTITDSIGMQTVALRGYGWSLPTDTLSTATLNFPPTIEQTSPTISSSLPVTITNSGDEPLTSIAISISSEFQIFNNNCTSQLAGNSSCTISVAFVPTAVGLQTETLTIADSSRTQTVALCPAPGWHLPYLASARPA